VEGWATYAEQLMADVGNAEMNDIRAAWEKSHGKYPDLRSLHDAMLSFGNAAPKYVKERLGM
jgi:uncharacterized protein (DUF885 family)